ncbi:hypothetical protein [Clostridium sp.]|uniref:hypothetical protein n=1 Tax=Clostridium sp. TaxID=1506 RepID=UPI002609CBF9|nr:hypothetical protein [Clostridium sp.]
MKINKYKIPIKVTDKKLDYIKQKQKEFLEMIFPFLKDSDSYNDGAIEIRVLPRKDEKYIKSKCFWHTSSSKDIKNIREINEQINGKFYCVYYSCYAFDYSLDIVGKQKGKVNNQNALFTVILPMDFDHMSYEEFIVEKQKFIDLGIETIDVFTGHGFQSLIMLDAKAYDTTIIKRWTNLLLQKGIKTDSALVDAARVLRMPFSFNCKEFDVKKKDKYDNPECIAAKIVNTTQKRYNIVDVFTKIKSLDDSIPISEEISIINPKQEPITSDEKKELKKNIIKEIENIKDATKQKVENIYPMFRNKSLEEPLIKMFYRTPDGLRNKTILFLIPFLKNSMGLSIEKIKEVMIIWGSRCVPQISKEEIIKEVTRLYKNYNCHYGKYDNDMVKAFGYMDFIKVKKDNKVIINNAIIDSLADIQDTAFKILMILYLDKANNGQRNYTINQLIEVTGLSRKTLDRNLKELLKSEYITKCKKISKFNNELYKYYLNPYFESAKGFIMIDKLIVNTMIKELTGAELKLCIHLFKSLGNEDSVWSNQKNIAKAIGKTHHSTISKITDSLENKGFIKKEIKLVQNIKHCTYYLKF